MRKLLLIIAAIAVGLLIADGVVTVAYKLVNPSISRNEFNAVGPGLTKQQLQSKFDDGALEAEGGTQLDYRADTVSIGFPLPSIDDATAEFVFSSAPGKEPKLIAKHWISR